MRLSTGTTLDVIQAFSFSTLGSGSGSPLNGASATASLLKGQ
jgi:hypothetical protein